MSTRINHVIPLNDKRNHSISTRCACHPLICDVIVHHAWDNREKSERRGRPIKGKDWGVFPSKKP